MDYDDDDISRHNLQLAGEGRTKSSSVLRPYDFPKFDFDDSLQGHLKFDSLVETEVFLGIQSQEDNQWIEDFSRGSNGMEFNSNPADSCSISRRDNVWSEATSSESVEMLLKSVGQEEVIPTGSIMSGLNGCDDQGTLTKPAEPVTDLDEGNVAKSDTTVQQDEVHNVYPVSKVDKDEQLPQTVGLSPIPEDVGLPQEISHNLIPSDFREKGGLLANEGKQSYNNGCPEKILVPEGGSAGKAINSGAEEDAVRFADVNDSSSYHITSMTSDQVDANVSCESGNGDGQERQVNAGTGLDETAVLERKTVETNIDTLSGSHIVVAESGELNSQEAIKAGFDTLKDSTNTSVREPELRSSEADGKNASLASSLQTLNPVVEVLATSGETRDALEACLGGSSTDGSKQQSAELGSFHAEHSPNPELKMDSSAPLTCRLDYEKKEDVKSIQFQGESMSETPLLSMEGDKVSEKGGDGNDTKANTGISSERSGTTVLSSDAVNNQTEADEGCPDESPKEPGVHLPAHVMDNSRQVMEDNLDHMQADFSESGQATCKIKEAEGQQLSAPGNMDPKNVGLLNTQQINQSLDVDAEVKGNDSLQDSQCQTSGKMESGYAVVLDAKSASAGLHGDTENRQREPAAMGLSLLDNNREANVTKLCDVNIRTEVANISEVEVGVADDTAKSHFSETVGKCQQSVEKTNDVSCGGSSPTEVIYPACSDNQQVHLGCGNSSVKDGDGAGSGENYEVATRKPEGDQQSVQVAEADKASCGSPTIISSSEPSQVEKDDQERARGSECTDKFVQASQPTLEDTNGKDAIGDDNSFTFKVNLLPETTREQGNSWSPFPDDEKCKSTDVVKESSPSGKGKTEIMPSPKTPRQSSHISDMEPAHGTPKATSERKGRRASGKGTTKETAKKGSQAKVANQEIAVKVDKISSVLPSTASTSPHAQFGQMHPYGNNEASNTKLSSAAAVPISNLPDLNSSALNQSISSSASFRQPFTDLQQVQLRAQIFVYGSLIQGTAPDEACMVSAFGQSDVGRNTWEQIWRVSVERVRKQKSSSSTCETPLRSQSAVKHGSHSSKMVATHVSKVSSNDTPATTVNPIIPLSSPLWSISTPRDSLPSSAIHKGPVMDFQQSVNPLHSYQTPPIRNFVGHTSWPSQTCFPSPWLASPQTATFSSSVRFQPVTMTETVKLTPVKETLPPASGMKHMPSSPAVHTVGPSPVYRGVSPQHDQKTVVSSELQFVDSKPRKRKKVPASDPGQIPIASLAQTAPVVKPNVATLQSSFVSVPALASHASDTVQARPSADVSAICSIDRPKEGELDKGKAVACSAETLNKVSEAKCQAEDAADLATAAVRNCEDLWAKLAAQKESGLISEGESKLASAAAAIAAAASVAKAAAAAARIACNAAIQAKLMADEVLLSNKIGDVIPSGGKLFTDVHDIGNATPTSIFKGNKMSDQSSSILVAAKEAAKRRVEAASAASKQAENLDCIVKAAELAAAAVAQAGKIVAMGEPLPLNELIEAGPEGYWKLPHPLSELPEKLRDGNKESGVTCVEEGADIHSKASGPDSVDKPGLRKPVHGKMHARGRSKNSLEVQMCIADGTMGSMHTDEKEFRKGQDHKSSDAAESCDLASETNVVQRASDNVQIGRDQLVSGLPEESIKEGSLVEVLKSGDGLKSAWYSASVLTLEDGKAYVSYTDIPSEEGSGNLCEWVPLDGERDNAPLLRATYPLTTTQYQGTRKRRRAALGDYAWCVGDKVDVWIDDCWWEGVVTEKNEKDETTLKVHLPAQGETSTVRAWNLRASRSWIDGKWVECSSLKGHHAFDESDKPLEKRQKLGSPPVATRGKDKMSNDVDLGLGKPEESKLLALSTSEKTFDIGKTTKEDKRGARSRPWRTGQQKEGSRVVFGVPKPTGKKRKFMEVSKHFPASKSVKSNEANETVKFAKSLIPQGTSSRGWKVPSRNDSKEKRPVEPKPRVPSTRRAYRTLPQKNNLNFTSGNDSDSGTNHDTDAEDSVGQEENTSEKSTYHVFSASDEAAEAPLSSLLPHSLGASTKKVSSSNSKSERFTRGKLAPTAGKLSKIEEEKIFHANSVTDASEPRRSNRRIQPTHRLLEGLQSSMVIPKMPSVSNDRGHRGHSRIVPSRGK